MLFINKVLFVKKNRVTQVKLVTKIKKHNHLYFGTLVLASVSYCCCGDKHKIRTSCNTLASKKAATWRLKQSRGNDKLS